jgi:hypothetical protein
MALTAIRKFFTPATYDIFGEFFLTSIFTVIHRMLRIRRAKLQDAITVVPPCPRVIRSKTYRVYVKPRIIPNDIHNVTFVQNT